MASLDADYSLIGVYERKSDEEFTISEKNLKEYLVPKKISKSPNNFYRKQ
jgi:hypothetical protein